MSTKKQHRRSPAEKKQPPDTDLRAELARVQQELQTARHQWALESERLATQLLSARRKVAHYSRAIPLVQQALDTAMQLFTGHNFTRSLLVAVRTGLEELALVNGDGKHSTPTEAL